jgi:NADH dehydrogenase
MRVLVTGGTGVIGASTITALLQRGHTVRLLSRNAERDARSWRHGVTPAAGDVSDAASIEGCADGCDAVIHLVAIVEESPPEATFARVNVEGTRNVVREAERAGVSRLVYVSSLGADRGVSEYHRSKRAGEEIARRFPREWVILRPGAVYGPGDEHLSVMLKLVRTLPVVPMVGDGGQRVQPAWHEDVAEAIAASVERDDLVGRTLELAGDEVTTQRELLDLLGSLTNRAPAVAAIPPLLATLGVKAAELVGVDVGLSDSQLQMLFEESIIPADRENALVSVFGIDPTPLRAGLARLADVQPEQPLSRGVGPLRRKRYWADIRGAQMGADELFALVRSRFGELMPSVVESTAESGTPWMIEEGATLTLGLPLRGHVQVRAAELDLPQRRFTLVTLDGHPLAGTVRISVEARGQELRVEVQAHERPATLPDFLVMRTLGDPAQTETWKTFVRNVVRESGGLAEVAHASEELAPSEARLVEQWADEMVLAQRRDESGV